MSIEYPCVYWSDAICNKLPDDKITSWCVDGPCGDQMPSNADRIRAMNDQELADVVANGVGCVLKAPHRMEVDCTSCILKWLQQPAESEGARETANYCPNCGAKMDGGGN